MTAPLSEKFVGKYMRQARQVGEDNNPCYSRHIGVVLVRVYPDGDSKVLGSGYNGPPRKTPHCDSRAYLESVVLPQLRPEELDHAVARLGCTPLTRAEAASSFLRAGDGCKQCPRKLIGAGSGERTELCSCEHAEKNAIANAACDLHGAWCFGWCGVACWDCAKLLINAGVKRCYFVDDGSYARNGGSDYSFGSRWLFAQAGVELVVRPPEEYLACR